jgi:hypothetical protein
VTYPYCAGQYTSLKARFSPCDRRRPAVPGLDKTVLHQHPGNRHNASGASLIDFFVSVSVAHAGTLQYPGAVHSLYDLERLHLRTDPSRSAAHRSPSEQQPLVVRIMLFVVDTSQQSWRGRQAFEGTKAPAARATRSTIHH